MTPRVRPARPDEATALGAVVAAAFFELELSAWLVPDEERRRALTPAHFALFTEHAAIHGRIYTTDDHAGVACWLPDSVPEIPDFERRNRAICGDRTPYFDALGACFDAHHPHHEPHQYLEFLAVLPGRRDQGLGSALMAPQLARADTDRFGCYLEASDRRSRALYLRHGYRDLGEPIRPAADAPPLYPMWRPPSSVEGEFIDTKGIHDSRAFRS